MYINYEFPVISDPYNVCLKHFVYPELFFLLPEYLSVSKEIFFLFIAYIIFPDLFYYCNNHVIVEVLCSYIM